MIRKAGCPGLVAAGLCQRIADQAFLENFHFFIKCFALNLRCSFREQAQVCGRDLIGGVAVGRPFNDVFQFPDQLFQIRIGGGLKNHILFMQDAIVVKQVQVRANFLEQGGHPIRKVTG